MGRIGIAAWQLGLTVWLVVAATCEVAAQGCAMCRTALGGADDPLARGFYWSILCLMGAPYVVTAAVGGWIVYRHVVAARADAPPAGPPMTSEAEARRGGGRS